MQENSSQDNNSCVVIEERTHKYKILNNECYKTGIYCRYQYGLKIFQQFIKIATIQIPEKYSITGLTNDQRMRAETGFNKLKDSYSHSIISKNEFFTSLENYRKKLYIQIPLGDKSEIERQLKKWDQNRRKNLMIADLLGLLEQGIEIIQIKLKPNKQINYKIYVLVDYGSNYPEDYSQKIVTSRTSILDIYPKLKDLRDVILLDPNKKVLPNPNQKGDHSQAIDLGNSFIYSLLNRVNENNQNMKFSEDRTYLKFIGNVSSDPKYCIATLPDLKPTTRISRLLKQKYISLMYGKTLQVISNNHDFNQFLLSYSFYDKLHQQFKESDQKIIVFSPNQYLGFVPKGIHDVRLDLIRFENSEDFHHFSFIFLAIDIVYGERLVSNTVDLKRILNDIKEFDVNELHKINSISSFQSLLAKQLTNQSIIGETKSISKIYQQLRFFKGIEILDPVDTNQIGVSDFPNFVSFDSSTFSPSDSFLMIFSILYKIMISSEKKGYKLFDHTVVIDDPRIIKLFSNPDVLQLFTNMTMAYKGLRIILHSTDPRVIFNLNKVPQLSINQFNEENKMYYTYLKFGESNKIEVNPISLSWDQIRRIEGHHEIISEEVT